MSAQSDIQLIQNIINGLNNNPVARLSYTQTAFDNDQADGVDTFDRYADQNIPKANKTDYSPSIIDKGVRSQGASIPRMGWNHYMGRLSYNVNKLVQKLLQFLSLYRAAAAHNANEYDAAAYYKTGDVCYTVETEGDVRVYAWHQRVSVSPETIAGIPPSVKLHWAAMQEKASYSSLLPFSAPGYRHKFSVVDLTGNSVNKWYPATTSPQDFEAKPETGESAPQIHIEAFCSGPVAWSGDPHRAELAVLSRFTGFAENSSDILLNNVYLNEASGAALDTDGSPIGFSKLSKGRQAALWLRGGAKYALWNSHGSAFSLHTSQYNNGVDADVLEPVGARPLALVFGALKARLKTPDAVDSDDAVSKAQADGSLPLPKTITQGANLRSIRTPGSYITPSAAVANSVQEIPVANPGLFGLTVTGDKAGLSITTQTVVVRETGDVYTRVLAGNTVTVPWYLSASPNGTSVSVSGLYRFDIQNGNLLMYYRSGDQAPPFRVNDDGELEADIA